MTTYTTVGRQTVANLALQLYGNIDAVRELLLLNDLTDKMSIGVGTTVEVDISRNLISGTVITYDENSPLRNEQALKDLGGRIVLNQLLPRDYQEESLLYFAKMEDEGWDMTTDIKNYFDDMIVRLKDEALWTKMFAIYPYKGGTAATVKYNLKDPRDLNVAYRQTIYNAPTIDAEGVQWNGVNQYADTYYQPTAAGNKHLSYYCLTASSNNLRDIGASAGGNNQFYLGLRPNQLDMLIAMASSVTVGDFLKGATGTGYGIGTHTGTSVRGYWNGLPIAAKTKTAGSYPSIPHNVYIGAINLSGSPSLYTNAKVGFVTIGEELSDAQAAVLDEIVYEFMIRMNVTNITR